MPGVGGYGRRNGLEYQLLSGHIEIAGAGWVHMQIDTLLPHCRYLPAAWLTDTVRQLLTAYMQHTNFRLHFRQMSRAVQGSQARASLQDDAGGAAGLRRSYHLPRH